jgi:methionyl-tRNA formyltransferase
MKIVIITQEETFYLPTFLRILLQRRSNDVVGMTIMPATTPKKGWRATLQEHFALFGLRTFLYQSLRFCLYRLGDLAERTLPLPAFYSVRAVAQHFRVPLLPTSNINGAEYLARLRALAPDVIISVNAPQIFKRKLLELPRLGCINVHGALLPKYRGRLPSFWVLLNGEKETGVTVHFMNEDLDDGPIIRQRIVPIAPDETQHSLLLKTKQVGAELLLEALEDLERGSAQLKVNARELATYNSFPTPQDGRRFRQLGRRFI